jgi:LysM repeat protein
VNSLKTGVIIAFGLTVLYGVYLVINKPEPSPEAQATADAVEDLSIGDLGMDDSAEETASQTVQDEETPIDQSEPAAEVARSEGRNRKFEATDEAAMPTDDLDGNPEMDDPLEPEDTEVAPWRKKQEPRSTRDADAAIEEEADLDAQEKPSRSKPSQSNPAQSKQRDSNNSAKVSDPPADELESDPIETLEPTDPEVKISQPTAPTLGAAEFDAAWTKMESEIEEGKLKEALTTISPFYHATDLSEDDAKQLIEVLDLLAWRVLFSKEHFLLKPHIVKAGETLNDVAQRYQVPAEVIAKINGIKSAKLVTAGTELKVLPGPFRAEVAPDRGELTLFLGDLYATRYAVESGTEPPPEPGEYTVLQRTPGAAYRTKEQREIAAQHPRNPYGGVFLDLGNNQCLHGSPEEEEGEEMTAGCMRLRGKDAREVYWLLSKGSKVTVIR